MMQLFLLIITMVTCQKILSMQSNLPESKIYHYENEVVEELSEFEQKINYKNGKTISIREWRLNDDIQTKLLTIESINTENKTGSLLQISTDSNNNYEEKTIEYKMQSPKKIDPALIKTKVSKLIGKNPHYNQESK
ncbi:MAG: hypothetical protein ACXWL5_04495 [Candidatus Chromulinivorax sp.]